MTPSSHHHPHPTPPADATPSQLWKRRLVTLAPSGHLVFTPAQQAPDTAQQQRPRAAAAAAATKRFHLMEFARPPASPDLDRRELPHSVVLEFGDGTSLQVAGEDAGAARRVLGVLGEAWGGWNGVARGDGEGGWGRVG